MSLHLVRELIGCCYTFSNFRSGVWLNDLSVFLWLLLSLVSMFISFLCSDSCCDGSAQPSANPVLVFFFTHLLASTHHTAILPIVTEHNGLGVCFLLQQSVVFILTCTVGWP